MIRSRHPRTRSEDPSLNISGFPIESGMTGANEPIKLVYAICNSTQAQREIHPPRTQLYRCI